jgi:hypothetical protein
MTNMVRVTSTKGESTVAIKQKDNIEMGTKRMGHDRPHGVWRCDAILLPIHRTSKYGPIQYMSENTTTLLSHHGTVRHIIYSYVGPHLEKCIRYIEENPRCNRIKGAFPRI